MTEPGSPGHGRPAEPAGVGERSLRPVVAVVGRPNVGKSALVNRLVGGREAITEERPGVTRDRTTHVADWRGRQFTVVDTGGWLPTRRGTDPLAAAVSAQAEAAVADADVIVLVVDASGAPTDEDDAVARWLRRAGTPVVLAANKADRLTDVAHAEVELAEWHRLGLGEPHAVSALHGTGSGDLLDVVFAAAADLDEPVAEVGAEPPSVAILGRPNVGKSSLLNRLAGIERAIVDDRPGTTRDVVDTVVTTDDGRSYRFVDTAGLRRAAKVRRAEPTEYYASVRTTRALERADVALLTFDAAEPLGEAEQKLARQIVDVGRAVVLVANQWDRVDAERGDALAMERQRLLGFVSYAPLVRTSAATGRGLPRLLAAVDEALAGWSQRVPTSRLTAWLADAVAATPPPMHGTRPTRLRHATQPRTRPPTVVVFGNAPVPDAYRRYLERSLREHFGFVGSPLRVQVRVRARWEERQR